MKKLLAIIAALVVFGMPAAASAAISVVTVATSVSPGGTSVDMGSAANRVAFLFIQTAPGAPSAAPTINGSNMTKAGSTYDTGIFSRQITWYYMINPTSGSQTVDPLNSGNFEAARVIVFGGVDQTSPVDSQANGFANTGLSLTLTTTVVAANSWLLGGAVIFGTPAGTVLPSFDATTYTTAAYTAHSNATVGTGSQSGTFVVANADPSAGIVLSIAAAASAASTAVNRASQFFSFGDW